MPELLELAERLRTVRHFQHFGLPDLLEIIQSGNVRRFREAEMIFRQDEPCAGMHVLIHGLVRLCKYGPQGQMIIIKIIRPVIMFNEVAVLDGGVNPVWAQAAQDSLVWQIGFDSFQRLLHRYPEIGIGLLRVLASRNRQMIAHFEDLSFRTVQARLAKLLLELSENS